jgi:hypothetical protein
VGSYREKALRRTESKGEKAMERTESKGEKALVERKSDGVGVDNGGWRRR